MILPTLPLALFGNLMGMDGLVILVIGLLFFGRRLPEVGKNLGKTIVEFKKGLNGSYSEKEKDEAPAEEEVEQVAPKRLASGTRVSATTPVRKRLAETEEV